jgi:hypothetical protein
MEQYIVTWAFAAWAGIVTGLLIFYYREYKRMSGLYDDLWDYCQKKKTT